MDYKMTKTGEHLVEMLYQRLTGADAVIGVMLLLPEEPEQLEMIEFLQNNPSATQDDIIDLTMEITTVESD